MTGIRELIKLFLGILLMQLSSQTVNSQALIKQRSTLSISGSSKTITSRGQQFYMQDIVGQSGAIGLSQRNNYLLRQGFIQPIKGSNISIESCERIPRCLRRG